MTRRHRRVMRPATGGAVPPTSQPGHTATGSPDPEGAAAGAPVAAEPSGSSRRVPEQTVDDTDSGWGEPAADPVRDRWLQEQRPPHWE